MGEPLLSVDGLVKSFGGLLAVNNLSLSVPAGSILGLIGVNGAGKTTVMNCINGIYRSDAGRIGFAGADLTHKTPHEVAHAGIGRTFQVPRIFRRMTLIENVLVPMLGSRDSDAVLAERAEVYLDRVKLRELRHNFAEELSGGQQKLLELARVMMFDPKLILLDEPFAGVNPALCRLFIEQVEALLTAGKTFVLVSHDLTSIYRLSDHVVVLNQGQKIAEGSVEAIRRDPAVIEAYLGA
jgi:branched-chain amino acid transport system ATP-binding protein